MSDITKVRAYRVHAKHRWADGGCGEAAGLRYDDDLDEWVAEQVQRRDGRHLVFLHIEEETP